MENVPEAAPQGTEETPTTNTEPAVPAPAPTPVADIPADQIEAFNKFVAGQGGFNNAFPKWKQMVSTPQPAPVPQPQPVQPVAQPQQPIQPQQIPAGYITPEEYMAKEYFISLSREEQYAPIADQIANGSALKEMAEFGIRPMQNGMFNDGQIRKFLNLKAQTVPAKATSTPLTSTPTVDYVNVGEKITDINSAREVLMQNQGLAGKGVAEHPLTQQAKEFIKSYYSKQ